MLHAPKDPPMYRRERRKLIVPFLLPAVVLYSIFVAMPIIQSPYFSLTDWSGIGEPDYIGLENYRQLIGDSRWWTAVRNTLVYAALYGGFGLSLGLLFAVAVNAMHRGARLVKFIIFVPSILPVAAIALLWLFIYNPQFGLLNGFLRDIGMESLARPWLGDNATVLPAITFAALWGSVGGTMILFLAGLQKIPRDLPEAARVDGANEWQVFASITWPLLWEITRILIILAVISGLQAFGLFFVISGGSLREASQVTGTYLYMVGFSENRMGYATAIGVVLFVIILALTAMTNTLLKRDTVEY
jgi:ABC-type sugar transport system permease subunit